MKLVLGVLSIDSIIPIGELRGSANNITNRFAIYCNEGAGSNLPTSILGCLIHFKTGRLQIEYSQLYIAVTNTSYAESKIYYRVKTYGNGWFSWKEF